MLTSLQRRNNCKMPADFSSLSRFSNAYGGSNFTYCRGIGITGPDRKTALISLAMILLPSLLFESLTSPWYGRHYGAGVPAAQAALLLVTLFFFITTACSDPGIIPRHCSPLRAYDPIMRECRTRQPPRQQEVVINGTSVRLKYCTTCNMYRPPRSVHCAVCDNCVERFDHHCPWLGNCVGLRNYRSFILFIFFCSLLSIFTFVTSAVKLAEVVSSLKKEYSSGEEVFHEMWKHATDAVLLLFYTFILSWFILALVAYHSYLILTNQTTYEQIKSFFYEGNPWNRGYLGNLTDFFCRPIRPRFFDPTKPELCSLPREPSATMMHIQDLRKNSSSSSQQLFERKRLCRFLFQKPRCCVKKSRGPSLKRRKKKRSQCHRGRGLDVPLSQKPFAFAAAAAAGGRTRAGEEEDSSRETERKQAKEEENAAAGGRNAAAAGRNAAAAGGNAAAAGGNAATAGGNVAAAAGNAAAAKGREAAATRAREREAAATAAFSTDVSAVRRKQQAEKEGDEGEVGAAAQTSPAGTVAKGREKEQRGATEDTERIFSIPRVAISSSSSASLPQSAAAAAQGEAAAAAAAKGGAAAQETLNANEATTAKAQQRNTLPQPQQQKFLSLHMQPPVPSYTQERKPQQTQQQQQQQQQPQQQQQRPQLHQFATGSHTRMKGTAAAAASMRHPSFPSSAAARSRKNNVLRHLQQERARSSHCSRKQKGSHVLEEQQQEREKDNLLQEWKQEELRERRAFAAAREMRSTQISVANLFSSTLEKQQQETALPQQVFDINELLKKEAEHGPAAALLPPKGSRRRLSRPASTDSCASFNAPDKQLHPLLSRRLVSAAIVSMQNPHATGGEQSMTVSLGEQALSSGHSSFSISSRTVSASPSPTCDLSLPAAAMQTYSAATRYSSLHAHTTAAAPSSPTVLPAAGDVRHAAAAVAAAIEKEQVNTATESSAAIWAGATETEADALFLPPAAGDADAAEPCAAAGAAATEENDVEHNSLLLVSPVPAASSSHVPAVFHCHSAVLPHGEERGDAAAATTALRQTSAPAACAIVRTENRVGANDSDQESGLNARAPAKNTQKSCCHGVSQHSVTGVRHDEHFRRHRCSSGTSHFSPSHSAISQHASPQFDRRKSSGSVSLMIKDQNNWQEGVVGCRDVTDPGAVADDSPVVQNVDHLQSKYSSSGSTVSLTDTKSHFTCDCTKEVVKKQHSAARGRGHSATSRTSLLLSPSHKTETKNVAGSAASAPRNSQIPTCRQSCRRATDNRDAHSSHSSDFETHAAASRSPACGNRIRAALPTPRWNSMPFRLLLSSCFSVPSTWRQRRNSNNDRDSPTLRQARSHRERHSCPRVRHCSRSQKYSLESRDSDACCFFCGRGGAIDSAATGASQAVERRATPSPGTASTRCQCVSQQRESWAATANTCASLEGITEKRADEEGKDPKLVLTRPLHFLDGGDALSGVAAGCRDRRMHCRRNRSECNRCAVLGNMKVASGHKRQEKRQHSARERRQQQQQQALQREEAHCDMQQATTARRKNSISCRSNKVTHPRQRREISSRSHNTSSSKDSTSFSSKTGGGWCFGRAGTTGHRDRENVAVIECSSPLSSSVSSSRTPPCSSSSSSCFGGFHMRNLVVKCGSIACVLPDDDEDFLEERSEWEIARVRRSEEEAQSRTDDAAFPHSEAEEGSRGLEDCCVCHPKGRVTCRCKEVFHSRTEAMHVKTRERIPAGDNGQTHFRSEGKQCFDEDLHVKRQCSCKHHCSGSSSHRGQPRFSLSGWSDAAVGRGLYGTNDWPLRDKKVTPNDIRGSSEATSEVDNSQHGTEETYVTTV